MAAGAEVAAHAEGRLDGGGLCRKGGVPCEFSHDVPAAVDEPSEAYLNGQHHIHVVQPHAGQVATFDREAYAPTQSLQSAVITFRLLLREDTRAAGQCRQKNDIRFICIVGLGQELL